MEQQRPQQQGAPVHILMQRVRPTAQMPQYATAGSAAADLCAALDAPITLEPMQRATIPTGIAIALPADGFVALVFARSGLAVKHGLALSNGVGVIDADYRGEISVGLINLSSDAYTVQVGERIAQLCVMPAAHAAFTVVDKLDETVRGAGGFGSTGRG